MTTFSRPARQRPRRRFVRRFIPPQHGAWAMLLLPYLASMVVTGPIWVHLPLLFAWLAGYLASYYALQAIKTRRVDRVRTPLLTYATTAAVLALLVASVRPAVLWYAPAYAALLAINVWYARRRDERALVNDFASVVQGCLMVFVAATVAGAPPSTVVVAFAVVLAYFAGTVLYVKTMIRERGNASYRTASVAYHAAAVAGALWLGPFVAAVFALLLARAWLLPGRPISPKQVGLIEIGNCVLLLVAVAVA